MDFKDIKKELKRKLDKKAFDNNLNSKLKKKLANQNEESPDFIIQSLRAKQLIDEAQKPEEKLKSMEKLAGNFKKEAEQRIIEIIETSQVTNSKTNGQMTQQIEQIIDEVTWTYARAFQQVYLDSVTKAREVKGPLGANPEALDIFENNAKSQEFLNQSYDFAQSKLKLWKEKMLTLARNKSDEANKGKGN